MKTLEQITLQQKPKFKRNGLLAKLLPFLAISTFAACSGGGQAIGCKKDLDCNPEQICVAEKCVAPGEYCTSDYDCPEDSVCENNVCSDNGSSGSIPETTKIVDDKAASSLLSMSNDKSTIVFSTNSSYAQQLKAGDVMVAGVYDNIPVGLLRKVTSKNETSSGITLQTNQATLEDAIENGTIGGKITFTPEYIQRASPLKEGVRFGVKEAPLKIDYSNIQTLTVDFDGTKLYDCKELEEKEGKECYCPGCKVILDGSFEVGLKSEIKAEINYFKLKYAKFALTGTESLDLTLSGEFAASIETDIPEVTVATFPPIPLPVNIAGFPVIVVPSLSVEFGLEAEGELSLESSVSQSLSATYGIEYKNKSWSDIKDFDYDFDFVPPTLTNSGATARAYVKPKLNFDLYAINGPYTGVEASINGEVYPQQDPWCSLSAGLWVGVGFEAEILGYNLVDYKNTLYEYEKELYQCGGSTTCTDDCNSGETKCSGNGFKVCDDFNGDGCVEWGNKTPCASDENCKDGNCQKFPLNEFYDNSDGTVSASTGLTWEKTPNNTLKNWESASDYCNSLNLGGYTNWHLPVIDELRTLIVGCPETIPDGDCQVKDGCNTSCWESTKCTGCEESQGLGNKGCYLDSVFDVTCNWFWSSSTYGDHAWGISFNNGSIDGGQQNESHYYWCVRESNN